MKRAVPLEVITLLYMLFYIPYIILTKHLATTPDPTLGRPLSGLEILPASLALSGMATILWIWAAGWWKSANQVKLGPLSVPFPTRWTLLSGICTAFVLFTVPLSYTFQGVSIPYIQLLMRGDVLLIAPVVDLVMGRKVRWWSWTALALAALGMFIAINARGGINLPPIAIATIIAYTIGYFGRLAIMTKVSKTGAEGSVKSYFVEEKIVGIPVAIAVLAAISWFGLGNQGGQLGWGFVDVWSSPQLLPIAVMGLTLFVVSVFSILILLDARENTFCVPLERSASVLAGVVAAYVLAFTLGLPKPTTAELIGSGLLVAAIVVLSVAPRLAARRLALAEAT
ncbi:MAG: hypothetical protein WA047_11575 [Phenylobacterium sp.]|uniref:hypothetical protein n=1 Tax=Phenylobacterium sp. TaxID=1871053 RepID=UPI003BB7F5B6